MSENPILESVGSYYTDKLKTHGMTSEGVDWNSKESQFLRFHQLMKISPPSKEPISIADLGCGYGALIDYLDEQSYRFHYHGYDVSEAMIESAQNRYANRQDIQFTHGAKIQKPADYVIASGIFNVRMNYSIEDWETYLFETLHHMNNMAAKGFACNMLTAYSDAHKMRDYLYYPKPEMLFAYAKTHFGRNVALLHDYDLYECTILVRKIP